jgi:hypothetical protein
LLDFRPPWINPKLCRNFIPSTILATAIDVGADQNGEPKEYLLANRFECTISQFSVPSMMLEEQIQKEQRCTDASHSSVSQFHNLHLDRTNQSISQQSQYHHRTADTIEQNLSRRRGPRRLLQTLKDQQRNLRNHVNPASEFV